MPPFVNSAMPTLSSSPGIHDVLNLLYVVKCMCGV